jgi:hypothetical protein
MRKVNERTIDSGQEDWDLSESSSGRLASAFLRDSTGRRPVYGGSPEFQEDPHWRDLILFYEYSHGDNGAGLGASHQTGWTGMVAPLLDIFGRVDTKDLLETELTRLAARIVTEQVGGEARPRPCSSRSLGILTPSPPQVE